MPTTPSGRPEGVVGRGLWVKVLTVVYKDGCSADGVEYFPAGGGLTERGRGLLFTTERQEGG